MPDHLKSGVEGLSGMSMDSVKVHYNSDKPAGLQALAYAQGNNIHVGPGKSSICRMKRGMWSNSVKAEYPQRSRQEGSPLMMIAD